MTRLGADQRPGYREIGIVEGYDLWAPTYDGAPNPLIALEEPVTLKCIGNVQGQRVLDLGCGTGRYGVFLAQGGATVVGLDRSTRMLEQAKRKTALPHRFDVCFGTTDELPFPDGQFDLVVSTLTLNHLPDLEPALGEAARVLKGGGRIVISDIHPYWPISGHDYVEFFDQEGQEYRIPEYAHLVEEYWRFCSQSDLCLEDVREPRIDGWLIERFPSLAGLEGVPLAIVLQIRKPTTGMGLP